MTEEGKRIAMEVKKGDRILIGKYSGTDVKIDGTEYVILREDDVLGFSPRSKQRRSRRGIAAVGRITNQEAHMAAKQLLFSGEARAKILAGRRAARQGGRRSPSGRGAATWCSTRSGAPRRSPRTA